jgi:uncharacterized protein YbjT (DUF2867 family)
LSSGAIGKVGRQVVAELTGAGAAVRALARTPARLPNGVEVTPGDLTDPAGLGPALTGVETVFLVWPLLALRPRPPRWRRSAPTRAGSSTCPR